MTIPALDLSADEIRRYSRHLLMPEFGQAGQRRLKAGRVLIVGAGGLGSPAALYLAAAGVGSIRLVDADVVDETNLQRQVLYSSAEIGTPKLAAASRRLRALNPLVEIETIEALFTPENARPLVEDVDVVIDGTDNFPARYLVNDACVLLKRPNVFGSIARFEGQVSVFATPAGPCYRCLHPEPPPEGLIPSCAEAGVLGVLPGVVGTIQATEAIKILAGVGQPLIGRLLLYDALRMRVREIDLPRDPECPVCGDRPSIRDLSTVGRTCEPPRPGHDDRVTPSELRDWRRERHPHTLIDVREPSEHAVASIEGALLLPKDRVHQHLDALPRDRPVVVHCQTGMRSARVVADLRARGYDARNLVGGIRAWKALGS